MQRPLLSLLVGACLGVLFAGCGQSGSNPALFPEIRYIVQPAGQTSFAVDFLNAGGICHKLPASQVFTVSGPVSFFIENAPPPYIGRFRRIGTADIQVSVRVTGQSVVSGSTSGSNDTVTLVASQTVPPTPVPTDCTPNANPEVRFDVCAPSSGTSVCFPERTCTNAPSRTCSADGDCTPGGTCTLPVVGGIPGFEFTGTLGDAFMSHLISRPSTDDPPLTTPAMYFLENAQDSVNAVLQNTTPSQPLLIQLFIDGQGEETQSGTGEVIIRKDL